MAPLSGEIPAGQTATIDATFDASLLSTGTFEGLVRVSYEMSGNRVIDVPAQLHINEAPVVTVTSPKPGANLLEGGNVLLAAQATDDGGVITKVEFYEGANLLAQITSAPFEWTWNNLSAGDHPVIARAYDNLGAVGFSAPLVVHVQPDSDLDGLGDEWETSHFGDLSQTATDDYDNDGALNLAEFQQGTNPTIDDTDADGMTDGQELAAGLNPLVDDSLNDLDGDRYPNIFEVKNSSNPVLASSKPVAQHVVNASGSGTHVTIQSALYDANENYEIVEVSPGTYSGPGNVDLDLYYSPKILLISSEGAGKTILDAKGANRLMTLGQDVFIDGFTLQGGAAQDGAGIYVYGGRPRIVNCVVRNNVATDSGGAIYTSYGDAVLIHCTLIENVAGEGSGVFAYSGNVSILNSILWNESPGEVGKEYGTVSVASSIVKGGHPGPGNAGSDPALSAGGQLLAGSPAIDAAGASQNTSADMNGEPRPYGAAADIGADEYVDSDTDGLLDWWELHYWSDLSAQPSQDADSDGLTNAEELAYGSNPTSADSDSDGATDAAERTAGSSSSDADTDDDSLSDGYEIAEGLNPLSAADALLDKDGDRYPNLYEFLKGSLASSNLSLPAPDFTVGPLGSHTTIQAAVNAVTADHAIIRVEPGTYQSTSSQVVSISNRKLLLISTAGAASTVIDGQGQRGGIYLSTSDAILDGFTVKNGSAYDGGGITAYNSSPRILSCVLSGNKATNRGGALYLSGGQPWIAYSTFTANTATTSGAAIYASSGTLTLTNSIVWGSSSSPIALASSYATAVVSHSDVKGGYAGAGNVNVDPLLHPDGHLVLGSPMIDAGTQMEVSKLDMDGEARPSGAAPEMGADEW
ncbi:MAG: Ig-like domain-containing protein, partial [Verrucomicrobium sp.]